MKNLINIDKHGKLLVLIMVNVAFFEMHFFLTQQAPIDTSTLTENQKNGLELMYGKIFMGLYSFMDLAPLTMLFVDFMYVFRNDC